MNIRCTMNVSIILVILLVVVVGISIGGAFLADNYRTDSRFCIASFDCVAFDSCCGSFSCVNRYASLAVCEALCPEGYLDYVAIPSCGCENFRCTEK